MLSSLVTQYVHNLYHQTTCFSLRDKVFVHFIDVKKHFKCNSKEYIWKTEYSKIKILEAQALYSLMQYAEVTLFYLFRALISHLHSVSTHWDLTNVFITFLNVKQDFSTIFLTFLIFFIDVSYTYGTS